MLLLALAPMLALADPAPAPTRVPAADEPIVVTTECSPPISTTPT
jgi:hypothetical protein